MAQTALEFLGGNCDDLGSRHQTVQEFVRKKGRRVIKLYRDCDPEGWVAHFEDWMAEKEADWGLAPTYRAGGQRVWHRALLEFRWEVSAGGGN